MIRDERRAALTTLLVDGIVDILEDWYHTDFCSLDEKQEFYVQLATLLHDTDLLPKKYEPPDVSLETLLFG